MSSKKILSTIVKNMKNADADPLTPLLDRYLLERDLPQNRDKRLSEWTTPLRPVVRPLGRISPSSIGGCQRAAVFKMVGVKATKRFNPHLELIFEDGHWRHHKWQAFFVEMEQILGPQTFKCVRIERRVKDSDLYVAGSLDAEVRIHDRGDMVPWIVDVKGINKWGFSDILSNDEPKEAHVDQLLSYMKLRKVRRGMLLYDCKDDQRHKVFTIRFSKQEWARAREWITSTLDQVEQERLPNKHPDCNGGTYLYNKCPYRKLCFGDMNNAELERHTFVDFPGLDALWEEGLRLEEEG